jgi:hypothetical protein
MAAILAIVSVGATYSVLEMTLNIARSPTFLVVSLIAGLIAMAPLMIVRRMRVAELLIAIAVYGVFTAWLVAQPRIAWNMRTGFLRAYSQIRTGMRVDEVEAILSREFPGRRPSPRVCVWGIQYTLDSDDGRFNAEFILVEIANGNVTAVEYLDD